MGRAGWQPPRAALSAGGPLGPGELSAAALARQWAYHDRMARVFSGIKPTGEPHLGNFLGAVRWWVEDQRQGDCFYCVVDLHALTEPGDPAELHQATLTMATLLLAAGLDPTRAPSSSRATCRPTPS